MAEIVVFLVVDDRNFHLKLKSGDLKSLKFEFRSVCLDDTILKNRLETQEPCFSWKKPELKGTPVEDTEFELLNTDAINNYSWVTVKWTDKNLANQIHEQNNDKEADCEIQSTDADHPTRHGILVPFDLKLAKYYTQVEWDSLSPLEQQNESSRLEQYNLVISMGCTPDPFKPVRPSRQTRRSQSAAGKNVSSGSAEPLRKSARNRNKENEVPKATVARDVPIFFHESENEDDNFEIEDVLHVLSVPSTSRASTSKAHEVAPKLHHRKFGSRFNSTNSLPKFNPNLATKLAHRGEVNKQTLLTEIKAHLRNKKPDNSKIEKEDYDMVCQRIVQEYPVLGNPDDRSKFTGLKRSIQKSISSQTYYRNKGKAKRAARLAQRRAQASVQTEEADQEQPQEVTETDHEQPQAEPRNNENEQNIESRLMELKEGKQSESRMRYLIRCTMAKRNPQQFEPGTLNSILSDWPHYKNALMLVYEYSLKESLKVETLIQNAASFLEKLQGHLEEPDELACLTMLQDELTPTKSKNEKVKPLISVIEAVLAEGVSGVLDDVYEERSPHIIVTTDYNDDGERVAIAAVSKLSMDCCSICSNPTPATIIVLSLAPYFLFNLSFPPAYESTLRILEKYVHGNLSWYTSKKKAKKEYAAFMKDFEKY